MSRPRNDPEELLERGVRLALESGRPIAHVAADLGINPETLRKRVRQAKADSGTHRGCFGVEPICRVLGVSASAGATRPWCSATSRPRGPNELWLADLSYLRCWKGLVFFAFAALGRRGPRRLLHARRGDQPGRARSRAPSSRPPV